MARVLIPCSLAVLSLCPFAGGVQIPEGSTLNQAVVKFARDQMGKKVGDGECSTLAIKALESAGAKTTIDFGVSGLDKDYQWGTLVKDYADVLPGDVVQFRNAVTVTKTITKMGKRNVTRHTTRTYAHHTAIVATNPGRGKFKVFEQNVGGPEATEEAKRKVYEKDLDLAGLTQGTVWIYRPVKK